MTAATPSGDPAARRRAVKALRIRALAMRRAIREHVPERQACDTALEHLEAAVNAAIDAIKGRASAQPAGDPD
jgi:histone H3/H4